MTRGLEQSQYLAWAEAQPEGARFETAGSGVVVFAASTGTEQAKEDAKWDWHGAFTKALIDAIGLGKASINASGG